MFLLPELDFFNHEFVYQPPGIRSVFGPLLAGTRVSLALTKTMTLTGIRDYGYGSGRSRLFLSPLTLRASERLRLARYFLAEPDPMKRFKRAIDLAPARTIGRPGDAALVEKTLSNVFFLLRHEELARRARVAVLVRDGRDVITSKRASQLGVVRAALSWAARSAACLALHRQDRLSTCLVRYEDLVSDPESEVDRVVRELGIETTTNFGGEDTEKAVHKFHPEWENSPYSPPNREGVGRWRSPDADQSTLDVLSRLRVRPRTASKFACLVPPAAHLLAEMGYSSSIPRLDAPRHAVPRPLRRMCYLET